jgi:hypothetical protein
MWKAYQIQAKPGAERRQPRKPDLHNARNELEHIELLNADSPKFTGDIPGAKLALLDNQRTTLQRSIEVENDSVHTMGMIADKTGAGKSYAVLSLIRANQAMKQKVKGAQKHLHLSILVSPTSLFPQWIQNLADFYDDTVKVAILADMQALRAFSWEHADSVDLILTTEILLGMINRDLTFYEVSVDRVIYDEFLSNTMIYANFLWLVTASEDSWKATRTVEHLRKHNKESDIHSCVVKCDDAYVDAVWGLPPLQDKGIRCKTPTEVLLLASLGNKEAARQAFAGDVEGAARKIDSNVDPADPRSVAHKLLDSLHVRLAGVRLKPEIQQEIRKYIDKIRAIATDTSMCCLSYEAADCMTTCCSIPVSSLHAPSEAPCVLCGSNQFDTAELVDPKPYLAVTRADKSRAVATVIQQMHAAKQSAFKGLVVSQYETSFREIRKLLDATSETIPYDVLGAPDIEGGDSNVESVVRRFKTGDTAVLLTNANHYSRGLNLENVTDLILVHAFDATQRQQIIGRAQRPGRFHPLTVWNVIYDGEM